MAQFVLENFAKQTVNIPEDALKEPHFVIQGAYPFYSKLTPGYQEEDAAPLAASAAFTSLFTSSEGNIVSAIPGSGIAGGSDIYFITDKSALYAANGYSAMGYPTGGAISDTTTNLEIYSNSILCCGSLWSNVVRAAGGLPSYTNVVSVYSGVPHFLKQFADFCAYTDGDATYTFAHKINKITAGFSNTTGIDLGSNFGVCGRMENFNNQYLAIPAGPRGQKVYNGNYIFLWDGTSSTYNYAVAVPGIYADQKLINGTLYVASTDISNAVTVYYLDGLVLKELFSYNYSLFLQFGNFQGDACFVTSGSPEGIVVFDGDVKSEYQFLLDSGGWNLVQYGLGGTTYACTGPYVYTYPVMNPTAYNAINYISQYLYPEKATRGYVNWVKVYYDTPPQVTGDAINVQITVDDDEGAQGTLGNASYTLRPITSTVNEGAKKTRLDPSSETSGAAINFARLRLSLQTVNGTSTTWVPIIRKVVIDYTPLGETEDT